MAILSGEFLLFCGILLLIYYAIPGRWQWLLLLFGSFLFYGSQGMGNLLFLLFSILTTYAAARHLGKLLETLDRKTAQAQGKKWLILCLSVNFGLLFVCKVNLLLGGLLPLGISFYLFQSMGYLMDVYRGTVPAEKHIGRFALFVAFFPQLIQGPISRCHTLLPQLMEPHPFAGKQVSFGLQRMLWGYFKKLVIAQRVAPAVLCLRSAEGSFLLLSVLYAVQIYGDFTGGIDIVLGLSEALGIRLTENFRRPFFAKNTAEFWRRWHITLGEWMKDYVFYPVSVSKPMRKLSRAARKRLGALGKRLPVYLATLVTWLTTGLWHGLTPNFLLWGLMNCAVIVLSQELSPLYRRFHSRFPVKPQRWYGAFEMLRTFLLMNLIRLADLFPHVGDYFRGLGRLFSFSPVKLGLSLWDWVIMLAGCTLILTVSILQEKHGSVRELLWQQHWLVRDTLLFLLFLAVLLLGCYGIGYDAGNFIYSQF